MTARTGGTYTAEVEFRPAAGSGVAGVTKQITKQLTQARHASYIGATGSSPRRGVARIAAYMYENYPAGLTGKVAVRDLRSGDETSGPNEPIQTCITAAAGDCTLDI